LYKSRSDDRVSARVDVQTGIIAARETSTPAWRGRRIDREFKRGPVRRGCGVMQ
jgi:hypothetical protein